MSRHKGMRRRGHRNHHHQRQPSDRRARNNSTSEWTSHRGEEVEVNSKSGSVSRERVTVNIDVPTQGGDGCGGVPKSEHGSGTGSPPCHHHHARDERRSRHRDGDGRSRGKSSSSQRRRDDRRRRPSVFAHHHDRQHHDQPRHRNNNPRRERAQSDETSHGQAFAQNQQQYARHDEPSRDRAFQLENNARDIVEPCRLSRCRGNPPRLSMDAHQLFEREAEQHDLQVRAAYSIVPRPESDPFVRPIHQSYHQQHDNPQHDNPQHGHSVRLTEQPLRYADGIRTVLYYNKDNVNLDDGQAMNDDNNPNNNPDNNNRHYEDNRHHEKDNNQSNSAADEDRVARAAHQQTRRQHQQHPPRTTHREASRRRRGWPLNNNHDNNDSEESDLDRGTTLAGRFVLEGVIGSGGFGVVYSAYDWKDGKCLPVAVKIERGHHHIRSLRHEADVFDSLAGSYGVPPVLWIGTVKLPSGREVDALVLPLLGDSLYDVLRNHKRGHFSVETVQKIAMRVISIIEHVHARGWLHRDIKPHNFLIDMNKRNIYLVDYGLAKRWKDPDTGIHVPFESRGLRSSVPGTAKYASLNTHEGFVQSRRDDLEALAYTLIQLARGKLPWDMVQTRHRSRRCARIHACKANADLRTICGDLPQCFNDFLIYARALLFAQTPDYAYCRKLFELPDSRRRRK